MFPAFLACSEAIEFFNCARAASVPGVSEVVLVVEVAFEVDFEVTFAGLGEGFFIVRDFAPNIARNCG